jgi:hypothetical protein
MSKYNRKQKGAPQDEFISFWAKAFQKLEPYLRAIGFTLAGALVVLFGTWGVTSWLEGRAQNAAEMFGRAVKIYDADLFTGDKPPENKDERDPVPRFKTEKERADAALAALDKLDKQYGSSQIAHDALLMRAGILYDQGKYEDAQKLFEKLASQAPPSTAVLVVAKEGAALCDEQRGKLDDALAKYKAMVPDGKSGDFYRDRALYAQARIHIKKGENIKAAELLKEISTKMPTTPLKDEIAARLAQIEAK